MSAADSVLIVGGGLGGFTVAQELRGRGFAGAITLIDPLGRPYDRPPLSKDYLAGNVTAKDLEFVAGSWYAENNVELVDREVTALDPDTKTVTLDDGRQLSADAIVLALGGRARTLTIPGGDLPGMHVLRTLADADALRPYLAKGKRLAIIGAGLIGAETASTAVKHGAEVTLIDPVQIPLVPAVGQSIASELQDMHAAHGVRVICGHTTAISKEEDTWSVEVDKGAKAGGFCVTADAVLVAIGLIPNTQLASDAGLDVDNGILVDEQQVTSKPGIYAVGDVSRTRLADGTLTRRHEHWESALHSAQRCAAAITEQTPPAPTASWMWTDRYGVHVEAIGSMVGDGVPVVRESDGKPVAVFRMAEDGRMLGAASIDGGNTIRAARRIIDRGIVVDQAKLADPSIDLKKLAK